MRRFLLWVGIALGIAKPSYRVIWCEDIPDSFIPRVLYVEGNKRRSFTAGFSCPCGCEEVILLSLLQGHNPRWVLKVDWLCRPTLSPSVWSKAGCRSHFFLNRGEIIWCNK